MLKFILLHSPGNETHKADLGPLKVTLAQWGVGKLASPAALAELG